MKTEGPYAMEGGSKPNSLAFYTRLDITDDEQLRPRLAEPFATIIREAHEHSDDGGKGPLREHDTPTHVVFP